MRHQRAALLEDANLRDPYPNEFAGGLLLHDGTEVAWLAERVLAAPWWQVL